jgi:hypothetical protein
VLPKSPTGQAIAYAQSNESITLRTPQGTNPSGAPHAKFLPGTARRAPSRRGGAGAAFELSP